MPDLKRKTIGILIGYSLYEGNTISGYAHTVLQGILAAAREHDCNILISGGLDTPKTQGMYAPSWPNPDKDIFFVPVGPWNTDGLLVIPPLISNERSAYLQDLRRDGFPVLFAGPGETGDSVITDNLGGMFQAVQHLVEHGHRQIAFIAGLENVFGDSSQRLEGFRNAMQTLAGCVDERLIVYGQHTLDGGRLAACELLARQAPFTALITSNNRSAIGALQVFKESGKQVPEDISLIAVDEQLDAEAQEPPISTIYLNTFELGVQACMQLLRLINQDSQTESELLPPISIPSQLIVRRSCGCETAKTMLDFPLEIMAPGPVMNTSAMYTSPDSLPAKDATQALADLLLYKPDQLSRPLLGPPLSQMVLTPLFEALLAPETNPKSFFNRLASILDEFERMGGDPIALQNFAAVLRPRIRARMRAYNQNAAARIGENPQTPSMPELLRAEERLDEALLVINERIRRQVARSQVREARLDDQLGSITAELLTSLDEVDILKALAGHLSGIGIQQAYLGIFDSEADDPVAWTMLWQETPSTQSYSPIRFPTRKFPLPIPVPEDQPYQMVLVPLVNQNIQVGFLAFEAGNLAPCGAIARQVAAALRTCSLFRQATHGRRMAEEADQMKSRFLSTVSHELRTPLNLIIGFSELILDSSGYYGVDLPPALLADINAIQRNSQHLSRLIDDVLTLNQIEAGRITLNRDWITIPSIVEEATAAVQAMFKSKHLTLETIIAPDLPPVFCDDTRIRQVFLNLLSNAGRFTERGGVEINIGLEGREIIISVADTGPGISPTNLDKIFEPFRQLDSSLARRHGGTGLGLSISKNFIEMHGGRIWLESQLGVGTTFFFSLPLTAPLAEELAADDIQPRMARQGFSRSIPAESERYVVLEEEHALSLLLRRSGAGAEFITVNTLEDAILELQRQPTRALLIAQNLVEKILRQKEQMASIPVNIPIITCPLPGQDAAARQLGVVHYLIKPVSRENLLQMIADLDKPVKTILLVDDQPEVLQLLSRILTSSPNAYRVLQTTSAVRALHMLHSRRPDLILLDLLMPDMDGFQFLQEKNQVEKLRSIPVIVISSHDPRSIHNLADSLTVTRSEGLSEHDLLNLVKVLGNAFSSPHPPADPEGQADFGGRPAS